MSRRNIEMAGLSSPSEERQHYVRLIEMLEQGDARVPRTADDDQALGLDRPPRPLAIEGANADASLVFAHRALAREQAQLAAYMRGAHDRKRLGELMRVAEERAHWGAELIQCQQHDARETLTLLFESRLVETERVQRTRTQRDHIEREVADYLRERDSIDDLHKSMAEDRWLTRERVLREAAANREAHAAVEAAWTREREHVFLDEADLFR